MASKAVLTLLATATALAQTVDSAELKDGIEALEFLGDEANGNAQEYKDLKEIVEKIQSEEGALEETDDENINNEDDEATGDGADTLGDEANGNAQEKPKKKLSYLGIRQIGSLWYSSKDKYKKSFATADECAEHFNKE